MSGGMHKCEHCGEFHGCGKPTSAGCLGAIGIVILLVMLTPMIVDLLTTLGCSTGYSWTQPAQGCEAPNLIINDNLERRVKALEEGRK